MKILGVAFILILSAQSFAKIEGFNKMIQQQSEAEKQTSEALKKSTENEPVVVKATEFKGQVIEIQDPVIYTNQEEVTVSSKITSETSIKKSRAPASVEQNQFKKIDQELKEAQ